MKTRTKKECTSLETRDNKETLILETAHSKVIFQVPRRANRKTEAKLRYIAAHGSVGYALDFICVPH